MLVGILSILAAAGLTLVDQLIKLWATVELLPVGSKPFIPHVLEFYYLLNDGMSFSMLSGKRTLLVIVTGVMLAVLAGMLLLRKMPRLERAAWILVVGGGVGNLIDRIRTGVVVDYLNCLFINFPVFNFADVCICVGVGLLVLSLLLDMRREQKAKQQKGSAPTDGTALTDPCAGKRWPAAGSLAGGTVPGSFPQPAAKPDRSGQCDLQRQPLEQKG